MLERYSVNFLDAKIVKINCFKETDLTVSFLGHPVPGIPYKKSESMFTFHKFRSNHRTGRTLQWIFDTLEEAQENLSYYLEMQREEILETIQKINALKPEDCEEQGYNIDEKN